MLPDAIESLHPLLAFTQHCTRMGGWMDGCVRIHWTCMLHKHHQMLNRPLESPCLCKFQNKILSIIPWQALVLTQSSWSLRVTQLTSKTRIWRDHDASKNRKPGCRSPRTASAMCLANLLHRKQKTPMQQHACAPNPSPSSKSPSHHDPQHGRRYACWTHKTTNNKVLRAIPSQHARSCETQLGACSYQKSCHTTTSLSASQLFQDCDVWNGVFNGTMDNRRNQADGLFLKNGALKKFLAKNWFDMQYLQYVVVFWLHVFPNLSVPKSLPIGNSIIKRNAALFKIDQCWVSRLYAYHITQVHPRSICSKHVVLKNRAFEGKHDLIFIPNLPKPWGQSMSLSNRAEHRNN